MSLRVAIVSAQESLPLTYIARTLLVHGCWPATARYPRSDVQLVDRVEDADLAMLSSSWQVTCSWESEAEARQAIERTGRAGRRTLIFADHDATRPLGLAPLGGIVYRTSMMSGTPYVDEFAKPGFANAIDPDAAPMRPWHPTPVVTFVGQTSSAALTAALTHRRTGASAPGPDRVVRGPVATNTSTSLGSPMNVGLMIRRRAVEALRASARVHTAIIERDRFFGDLSPEEQVSGIVEFNEHMVVADYGLCARGAGNYSYRLYETLAAGRIPVIVDTAMVLPFADRIDWATLGVWVPMSDLDSIGDRVEAFHRQLGPEGFSALQHRIRDVYRTFLSRSGFVRTVFAEDMPRLLAKGMGT